MNLVICPEAPQRFWASRAIQTSEPSRYKAGDIRLYPIPNHAGPGFLAVPGVTSVLSFSDTEEDRARLKAWQERELAKGRDPNEGRERGTRVHGILEDYIRTGQCQGDTKDVLIAEAMAPHLDDYDEFLWNERPLRLGWEHCWSAPDGHPDRLARVWSSEWGFAGTPDLISRHKDGATVLSDFKTSSRPYFRPAPGEVVPSYQRGGYKKFCKTVRQLCAYRMAIHEILGLTIDRLQIIVGMPNGKAQNFLIEGTMIDQETERFKKLVVAFWQAMETPERMAAGQPAIAA